MTTVKKTTTKRKANPNRVAVLSTHVGTKLVIRSNPSIKSVKEFVAEHNRRYNAGEPGGPDGAPAYYIQDASFYPSEEEMAEPEKATPIKL